MHFGPRGALAAWLVLLPGCRPERPDPGAGRWPEARESLSAITLPPGFEVRLFAAEPEVLNPVALDFDSRGRAYVLECLQYPAKAAPGEAGRDRLRILEDTDGDGAADRFTTFAEGLNLASGLAVGHGGVFVAQAPELLFFEDTDGDDRADRRTVLLDGWAFEDTHETPSNLIWGPDGWLYGCHGIMHRSKVRGKSFTAAVWRYHPKTRDFEVFAEGTNNPWGLDYDARGSFFVSTSVIPHLYHVVPGGFHQHPTVNRWSNPHAYGEIPPVADHRHFPLEKQEGLPNDPNSAGGHAHSGCLIYQGGAFPPEVEGTVFLGNLHGNRLNADLLRREGSTYVARHGADLLRSSDPRFRPIHLRTGPDGSIYLSAWHALQICHNTNEAAWDRSRGRIYRIAGRPSPVRDLARLSSPDLVDRLSDANSWVWRQALLILAERGDRAVAERLREKLKDSRHSLRALWALHAVGALDETTARDLLSHPSAPVRGWAVRLLGQIVGRPTDELLRLARTDPSPDVRLELACAARRWRERGPLLEALLRRDEDALDRAIPKMIWVALESAVAERPRETFEFLAAHSPRHPMIRRPILPWAVRRLAKSGGPADLEPLFPLLGLVEGSESRTAALDGLLEALRGKRLNAPDSWKELGARFASAADPELQGRLRRVGLHFGDPAAVAASESRARDGRVPVSERAEAVRDLALARLPSSVDPLLALVLDDAPSGELRHEALQALGRYDSARVPEALLGAWPRLTTALRRQAVGLLCGRRDWARSLVDALARGAVPRDDLTEGDARKLVDAGDADLARKFESAWGRLRARTPAPIEETLARFRRVLAGTPGDRRRGKEVFRKSCGACHTLHGEGRDVGPDLTGANRRDPEYLLVNIVDPNRVVGQAYASVLVRDRSGRVETGLLARESPGHVTLKAEGGRLVDISRGDIEAMKTSDLSLMPENLAPSMQDQDFSDLVACLMEDLTLSGGLVAGPLRVNQPLDVAFPVETAARPPETPGLEWRTFRAGPGGRVELEPQPPEHLKGPGEACSYVYAELRSAKPLETVLTFDAARAVKLWVNGLPSCTERKPVQGRQVAVTLHPGVNRFLFKVANTSRDLSGPAAPGASWLRARWADPGFGLEVVPPRPRKE